MSPQPSAQRAEDDLPSSLGLGTSLTAAFRGRPGCGLVFSQEPDVQKGGSHIAWQHVDDSWSLNARTALQNQYSYHAAFNTLSERLSARTQAVWFLVAALRSQMKPAQHRGAVAKGRLGCEQHLGQKSFWAGKNDDVQVSRSNTMLKMISA